MDESIYDWTLARIRELREEVKQALLVIRQQASANFTASTQYAYNIVSVLNARFNAFKHTTENNIIALYNELQKKANKSEVPSFGYISNIVNWADTNFNNLSESIVRHYNNANKYTKALFDYGQGILNSKINSVYNYINSLIPGDFKSLLQTVRIAKCILTCLVNSPIKCLIALLSKFFIEWIQYKLAYQFGTKNATLPSEPSKWDDICS